MPGIAFRRHRSGEGRVNSTPSFRLFFHLLAVGLALCCLPRPSTASESVVLTFPEGPTAVVGRPFPVRIAFPDLGGGIIGLRLRLIHPESLQLVERAVGDLVPLDARPIWTEEPGALRFSAIRNRQWDKTSGVAVHLVFVPDASFNLQASWDLKLDEVEVTSNGEDVRPVPSFSSSITNGTTPLQTPQLSIKNTSVGQAPILLIAFHEGSEVVLERSADLLNWREDSRWIATGWATPREVPAPSFGLESALFFRLRAMN